MSRLLTCPQGHRWELANTEATSLSEGPSLCPACGAAAAEDLLTDRQETFTSAASDASAPARPPADEDSATIAPSWYGRPETTGQAAAVPGYELLGELGRGGMGVVYKARQVGLNRMVALKMILAGCHAGPRTLVRFRIEAEAVARLQHPNIVQIYDVGERAGCPYFSLEFIGGGTLAQKYAGRTLPPRPAAQLIETLARAIHAAHQRGIIHRDLKPANVLLTSEGVPKIADFGLAKDLATEGPTVTEGVVGTPAYMAPEQITGKDSDVSPATDVYALGAMLYELLTGQPPFRGATKLDTLDLVRSQEPSSPGRLRPDLPRDLSTICLKCLHKQPTRRYGSAEALAEDLRRFREGEPILARPVGRVERAWKWGRRRPAVAALLAALVVVCVAAFAGITWKWREADAARREEARLHEDAEAGRRTEGRLHRAAEQAREEADRARQEAQAQAELAEANVYYSRIAQARLEWRGNNVAQADLLLDQCEERRRGWEWHYLQNLLHADLLSTAAEHQPSESIGCVVYSPDGQHLASAGGGNPFYDVQGEKAIAPGQVLVWDADTGKLSAPLLGHENVVRSVAYSPDGRHLASGSDDGTVRLWGATSRQGRPLRHHTGIVSGVAYSPDGRRLASASWDRTACIWDTQSGALLLALHGHAEGLSAVAFSPDGQQLASASFDRTVKVWDLPTGQAKLTLARHTAAVQSVAYSPDGRLLASAGADGSARVWDARTGQLQETLSGHVGTVYGAAFSPDGRLLGTAGGDRTVRVWDVRTGEQRFILRGHDGEVRSVSFHPHGRRLASAGADGHIKVWDLTSSVESRTLHPTGPGYLELEALAFTADGRQVVAMQRGGSLQQWDARSGLLQDKRPLDMTGKWLVPAATAAFTPDGRLVATVSAKNRAEVKLSEVLSGRELCSLHGHKADVSHVALSPDGGRVASTGWGVRGQLFREVGVWDAATGKALAQWHAYEVPFRVSSGALAFSPDGLQVATEHYGYVKIGPVVIAPVPHIKVWDAATGEERATLTGHRRGWIGALTFSPDGTGLASASRDGQVLLWDVASGQLRRRLQGADVYEDLAFSPDGRRLAGATRDLVMMWDAATGQEVLSLRGAPQRSSDNGFNPRVAFSPDGRQLAALNWDKTISVWDAAPRDDASRRAQHEAAAQRAFAWHVQEARAASDLHQAYAVAFHLQQLKKLETSSAELRLARGQVYARKGQWQEAAADSGASFTLRPPDEPQLWQDHALLRAQVHDLAGYRDAAQRMQQRFGTSADADTRVLLVRACALLPQTVGEPADLVRRAEKAVASEPNRAWYRNVLALAQYRAGRYVQAVQSCEAGLKMEPSWAAINLNWVLLAMAHHRLGQPEQARQWLTRAREATGPPDLNWWDGLQFQLLRKEAEELFDAQKP